jgi:prefoldin subunit 5
MSTASAGVFDPVAASRGVVHSVPTRAAAAAPEGEPSPSPRADDGDETPSLALPPKPDVAEGAAVKAPETPAEKPADDLTRRFNEITAADKAAREALRELKAEKARLEAEKGALARAREVEDLLKSGKGPEALAKLGVDLNTVAEWHLKDGRPDPLKEVGNVKESLGGEVAALRKEIQELKAERTVTEWRTNLTRELQAQSDEFDIVNVLGLQEEIENHAANYFQETGKLLSPAEAAATVRDRYEELVLKLKGSKRAQKLLGISVEKEPASTARAPKVTREPKPAINEAASPDRLDDGPMDRHERIAFIAAKFRRR